MATGTKVLYPEVKAPNESVGGVHETAGLPGYPAIDFFAPAGTQVIAPEAGIIRRLSGSDPSLGASGPGNVFGYSEYLHGKSGTDYFITHLADTAKAGTTVSQGQAIGHIADFPTLGGGVPAHAHIGTMGPVSARDLASGPKATASEAAFFASTAGGGNVVDWLNNNVTPEKVAGGINDFFGQGNAPTVADTLGVAPAINAIKSIGSVGDAIKFLFSTRGLEVIGGGALILIGVISLARSAGINLPAPGPAAAAAAAL